MDDIGRERLQIGAGSRRKPSARRYSGRPGMLAERTETISPIDSNAFVGAVGD